MSEANESPRHIYALEDPRLPGQVRYVGATKNLRGRLDRHISSARCGAQWQVSVWIRSLLEMDLSPFQKIIETVPAQEWESAERKWIAFYAAWGYLLNQSPGGGSPGSTPAIRAKIRLTRGVARNSGNTITRKVIERDGYYSGVLVSRLYGVGPSYVHLLVRAGQLISSRPIGSTGPYRITGASILDHLDGPKVAANG